MAKMTAMLVKELRERTGAGMMECKKALVEAEGNIEAAINKMRQSGHMKAITKAVCITAEGIILTKITPNNKYGVIIELNCETDFVAKSDEFKAFGNKVINLALDERITDLEMLQAKFEEQRTVLVNKINENIKIRRLGILKGDLVGCYLHGTHIGVMVSAVSADAELVKHVAMHIAASKPKYVNIEDVPSDLVARERQIQSNIAIQSGKSREIVEKIVEGRIRKFINEISLTGTHFVMDPNKTVGQLLNEYNAKVHNFIRFEVGENIEKAKVNLVSKMDTIKKNFN